MEEQRLDLDSAFHLSTEERTVKDEVRIPQTAELRDVLWTAPGPTGLHGETVPSLVEEEERLEKDSAFHLSREERTVKDEVRRPQTAELRDVLLIPANYISNMIEIQNWLGHR